VLVQGNEKGKTENAKCKMKGAGLADPFAVSHRFAENTVFILHFAFSVLHFSLPSSTPSPLAPG
jgi:hypothetical protein